MSGPVQIRHAKGWRSAGLRSTAELVLDMGVWVQDATNPARHQLVRVSAAHGREIVHGLAAPDGLVRGSGNYRLAEQQRPARESFTTVQARIKMVRTGADVYLRMNERTERSITLTAGARPGSCLAGCRTGKDRWIRC